MPEIFYTYSKFGVWLLGRLKNMYVIFYVTMLSIATIKIGSIIKACETLVPIKCSQVSVLSMGRPLEHEQIF